MKTINEIAVYTDTITYDMDDGSEVVLKTGFLTGARYSSIDHVILTLAAGLLRAHERIDALEAQLYRD